MTISTTIAAAAWTIVAAAQPAPAPAPPSPPEIVENSIGIKLAKIPAGQCRIGRHDSPNTDEKPRHQVKITKPYLLGVHEVTNAQWKRVMGSVPSKWKDDDRPVEQVSWEDAQEFCRKLSALPEERKAGRVYRLPTEAEWEYACRGGTTAEYPDVDATKFLELGWCDANSNNQTHPVGQKKANPWGLHDMYGNVWEWCSDWFGSYGRPVNDIPDVEVDPQGLSGGSERVRRGGSWLNPPGDCRSCSRTGRVPTFKNGTLGFRLAASIPDEAAATPAASPAKP